MSVLFGRFCALATVLCALLSLSGCQHATSYGTESANAQRSVTPSSVDTPKAGEKNADQQTAQSKPDVTTSASPDAEPDPAAEAPALREITFDTLKFTH